MIRYFFSMVALIITACVAQQFVPVLTSLYDAHILIFPLVFLCCAVTVNSAGMLPLAFLCGFLWDAQHHTSSAGGDPEVYQSPVEALRFGYSIVLYGAMGFFMQGIQPFFREGKWHVSALLSGAAIFLYLTAEYLLITFVRGDIVVTRGIVLKVTITSLFTMFLSPFIFWILFHLARMFRHTIRYEGLRTTPRRLKAPLPT